MNSRIPAILVVDDEAPVREYLREVLSPICDRVSVASNMGEAIRCMDERVHDVVLADICMPGSGGMDLLQLALHLNWDCNVVLMTGHARLEHVVMSVRLQAADFILKPFTQDTLTGAVQRAYNKLLINRQKRAEREVLSSGLIERTQELEFAHRSLRRSYRTTLETLVATLEAREYETYAHSFRVRAYAIHLARSMGYPQDQLTKLAYAALLHDIGKIAVSDSILLKPGPLTPQEFQVLKSHPAIGERIVSRMGFLQDASKIVRHHHERWDGLGYPDGLAGVDIPIGARLFAVADTLDAMTSTRCYRGALSLADARAEIKKNSGRQFDPAIAGLVPQVPDLTWRELRARADADAQAAIIPEDPIPGRPSEPPPPLPITVSSKTALPGSALPEEPSGSL